MLVNAGQANAATGAQGYEDCVASADAVAAALGVPRDDVLIESTGVIGRRIKVCCGFPVVFLWFSLPTSSLSLLTHCMPLLQCICSVQDSHAFPNTALA